MNARAIADALLRALPQDVNTAADGSVSAYRYGTHVTIGEVGGVLTLRVNVAGPNGFDVSLTPVAAQPSGAPAMGDVNLLDRNGWYLAAREMAAKWHASRALVEGYQIERSAQAERIAALLSENESLQRTLTDELRARRANGGAS